MAWKQAARRHVQRQQYARRFSFNRDQPLTAIRVDGIVLRVIRIVQGLLLSPEVHLPDQITRVAAFQLLELPEQLAIVLLLVLAVVVE